MVAPLIAFPSANHWYVNFVPAVHLPGLAVRADPTFAVPEIVGVAVVKAPLATTLVLADVLDTVVYPSFEPVTFTVMGSPSWSAVRTNVVDVAPLIALPEAYHWYLNVVPDVHLPRETVRVEPTFTVPLIVGVTVVSVPFAKTVVFAEVLEAAV